MKKLKIFLLLSILLCFGFALTYEVHAQGGGPKIFEVDDVLPTTTQLRIIADIPAATFEDPYAYTTNQYLLISVYNKGVDYCVFDVRLNDSWITLSNYSLSKLVNNEWVSCDAVEYSIMSFIIDTSTWTETQRTIVDDGPPIYWEDLNAPTVPSGPKPFEVDDVLPAGNIKISWDLTGYDVGETGDDWMILSDGVPLDLTIDISEIILENTYITMDIIFGGSDPNTGFYESFYLDTPGYTIITLTNPCTITSHDGSADYHEQIGGFIFWEVVSPEYIGDYDDLYDGELLDIEEDYILPQSKVGIKLLYNNTGGTKSGTITYTFGTYGQIILTAQEDNLSTQVTSAEITYNFTNPNWNIYMIDDTLASQSFGSTRGILFAGVLLDFSWTTEEERTITDITIEGDLEIDVIFTRILTEEEIVYQEGYSNGYQTAREIFGWKYGDDWYNGIDAWNLGEKYARELYGFYDSTTDEWLSVDEYVARYGPGNGNGNGSTGASDFYANFDKYFIPAMIIVFGGAIVLTILKVFKGRE